MENEKHVDESWKESANQEKIIIGENSPKSEDGPGLHIPDSIKSEEDNAPQADGSGESAAPDGYEVNFINYITSLGFQTLIFLGEMPNPVTQKQEKNLDQAKFLIDTLIMIKDKTKGNLSEQEDNLLGASIYELQMKFIEILKAEEQGNPAEGSA